MTTRIVRLTLVVLAPVVLAVAIGSLLAYPAAATSTSSVCDPDGVQPGGAIYRICMPSGSWNGDLVIYAHGYVPYNVEPLAIPENQLRLPNGTSLPELVNSLGFAFAATSYRTNGLAVKDGVEDLVELVDVFIYTATHGVPNHIYLTGVSEGGLITTLAIEQRPDVFDGGLAACGPIGDFHKQIDYFGDFRVLFDYFFPNLLQGDPISVPQSLIDNWPTYYATTIRPAILDPASADKVDQLLRVSNAPYISGVTSTIETSIYDALMYNVLATNDGIAKLGGQPFDNQGRVYTGSNDDAHLNLTVRRFSADQAALDEIEAHYQTTGQLTVPLVTLHTTLDQQVPYWHEPLYRVKVILNDSLALHQHNEVFRYGHCYFEAGEVLVAFLQLVSMVIEPPEPFPSPRQFLPMMAAGP
ncbi:MAG TPA: prolyl oligopeptidase family serine peptidase [Anaerolineae bacterium]|nr:prolyl oligopeptidase family serine peptidase [Anaerolineae bacterium]